MEKKNRISTAYWLLCAVAAVLFGVLSLRTNIWADEAYTFAMVRHSFADIWRITAADVHPRGNRGADARLELGVSAHRRTAGGSG